MKIKEKEIRSLIRKVIKENYLNEMDRMELYQDVRQQEELHYLKEPLSRFVRNANADKIISELLLHLGVISSRVSNTAGLVLILSQMFLSSEYASSVANVSLGVFLFSLLTHSTTLYLLKVKDDISAINVLTNHVYIDDDSLKSIENFLEEHDKEIKNLKQS